MVGLTQGTTKAHIARIALEGIADQVHDVLDAMNEYAGLPLVELKRSVHPKILQKKHRK